MVQQKVCPVRGEYAVMNRQELLAFFLEKRRENINFCKNCKKDDVTVVTDFYIFEINSKKMGFLQEMLDQKRIQCHANPSHGRFLTI